MLKLKDTTEAVRNHVFGCMAGFRLSNWLPKFVGCLFAVGFLFFGLASHAFAATYYVDNCDVTGNDTNNGTSVSTPWLTINKVNTSSFVAGDTISFRKGCTWREQITVPSSGTALGGNITFGAYGATGADPTINGSEVQASWTKYDIWQTAGSWIRNNSFNDNATRNFRSVILANTSTHNGAKIRVTVSAGASSQGNIQGASIGLMTTAPNYDAAPTRITFGGSNSTTVSVNTNVVSDEIDFEFDKTKQYGIHFYTTDRDLGYRSGGTNLSYYNSTVSDQSQNTTGPSTTAGLTFGIALLEVYDVTTGVWSSAYASDPWGVWDDGTSYRHRAADDITGVLANAGNFAFSGGSIYVHVSDGSDPTTNGRTYEVATQATSIDFDGQDYVTVENIECKQTAGDDNSMGGIVITGDHDIVRNLTTHDHRRHNISFYTGATNGLIDSVTTYSSPGTSPIAVFGTGTDTNTIRNSTIYQTALEANGLTVIRIHGNPTNTIIEGNQIYNLNVPSGTFYFIDNFDAAHGTIIRRNKFSGLFTTALHFLESNNVQIYDNEIVTTDSTGAAILLDTSTGSYIYNNSLYGTAAQFAVNLTNTSTGTLIKNNIFNTGKYISVSASSQTSSASNYNLFYGGSATAFTWGATAYSFADWKTNSSQDGNSLNSDPQFTSTVTPDLSLQSTSPAINTGTNLGSDYDDALHPTSSWPASVTTVDQDLRGSGWEMGAYVYPVPQAPTIGAPAVQSTSSVRWGFTDNASDETGFRVYDNTNALVSSSAVADLAFLDETGLLANTSYAGRYIKAYNSYGDSVASSAAATTYTKMETPAGASWDTIAANAITFSASGTLSNLLSGTSGLYFANTTASTNSGWTQTNSWLSNSLLENTPYTFQATSRNGDSVANTAVDLGSKYTLISSPTGVSWGTIGVNAITLSATGTLANLASGTSGLYFANTTAATNSSWTQTNSWTSGTLAENTQYTFQATSRNGDSVANTAVDLGSKYTLAAVPTNLAATAGKTTITLTVDSLPNDTSGSSGYYFSRTGANSGWIQVNSWQDTNLLCGHIYTYSVIYRNGDGTETAPISIDRQTQGCGSSTSGSGSSGGSSGAADTYTLTLNTPTSADVLTGNETTIIDYTSTGVGTSTVSLFYSLDDSLNWTTLATGLEPTGTYVWTVPNQATSQARLRANGYESAGAILTTTESGDFTIVAVAESSTSPDQEVGDSLFPIVTSSSSASDLSAGITTDVNGHRQAPASTTYGLSPFDGSAELVSTVQAGWLVRSPSYSTVYYIDTNLDRHVFWDAQTYFTWSDSWDDVVWVTDATLPTLSLSSPMLPKPGVVLIKLQSDPAVYKIESDSLTGDYLLRHITSESVAIEMYGSAWADYVLDEDPTMMAHFLRGSAVTGAESVDLSIMKTRVEIAELVR